MEIVERYDEPLPNAAYTGEDVDRDDGVSDTHFSTLLLEFGDQLVVEYDFIGFAFSVLLGPGIPLLQIGTAVVSGCIDNVDTNAEVAVFDKGCIGGDDDESSDKFDKKVAVLPVVDNGTLIPEFGDQLVIVYDFLGMDSFLFFSIGASFSTMEPGGDIAVCAADDSDAVASSDACVVRGFGDQFVIEYDFLATEVLELLPLGILLQLGEGEGITGEDEVLVSPVIETDPLDIFDK